jgi:hypothetical protein
VTNQGLRVEDSVTEQADVFAAQRESVCLVSEQIMVEFERRYHRRSPEGGYPAGVSSPFEVNGSSMLPK